MNYGNKNIRKKGNVALFGLLILANTIVCAQNEGSQTLNQKGFIGKALAAMATSNVMHRWNEMCGRWMNNSGSPASEELQKLAKEAQTAVGIPEERHVPVRVTDGPDVDGAMADRKAIYVSKYVDDSDYLYGTKRCTLFHESVHIKYHDMSCSMIPTMAGFFGAPILTRALIKPQGRLKLLYPISMIAGFYSGRIVQKKYRDYYERRADIEGHYATGCHVCVSEHAGELRNTLDYINQGLETLKSIENPNDEQVAAAKVCEGFIEGKKRYLSPDENEIIAADLKRDNKVCALHENQAK